MHLRIEFDSGVGPITGSALHNTPKLVGFYMGYYIVYNPNDNTTSTLQLGWTCANPTHHPTLPQKLKGGRQETQANIY